MRVRGESLALNLLTEFIQLTFAQAALKKGAGVDTRGGMPLIVNQVTFTVVLMAVEEVVVANIVERGAGGKRGNMPPQTAVFPVGAHDHGQSIPAHQRADAPFHKQVTGHPRLFVGRDGVAIGGGDDIGQLCAFSPCVLGQPGKQKVSAILTFLFQYRIECFQPFSGLCRIDVMHKLMCSEIHQATSGSLQRAS